MMKARFAVASCLILSICLPAVAASRKNTTKKPASAKGSARTARQVAPEAPAASPASQEAPPLEHLLRRDAEGLASVQKNGATALELDERYQHVTVATINEDGELVMDCSDSLARVRALLENRVRVQQPLEEK